MKTKKIINEILKPEQIIIDNSIAKKTAKEKTVWNRYKQFMADPKIREKDKKELKKHWWIEEICNDISEEAMKWFKKQDEICKKAQEEENKIKKYYEQYRKPILEEINESKIKIKKLKTEIQKLEYKQKYYENKLNKIDEEVNKCLACIITGRTGKTDLQEEKNFKHGIRIQKINGLDLLLTVKKQKMDGTNLPKTKSTEE